ncbi:aspartic-type endopeptidase [Apiospora aurea]|uniref:Aspartic-type endopeptidase n=1 Tax=Apiospora aurea TaxID=335848 RepID=A0ABR1QXW6_9PEZI
MKMSTRLVAIAAAALATGANAQLLFPFSRQTVQHGSAQPQRRSGSENKGSTDMKFSGSEATYVVDVSVGTPPQNLSMALTLSDYNSWVPDAAPCSQHSSWNSYYKVTEDDCLRNAFRANESSTLVVEHEYGYSVGNRNLMAVYPDGKMAFGHMVRDDMELPGGVQVANMTLGLVNQADSRTGVLSLGFNTSTLAAGLKDPDSPDDPTFVDRLLADGHINSKAFSMWLDSEDATTGNLLLGAVDKSAFEAPLVRFDLTQSRDTSAGYYVTTNTFSAWVSSFNTSATDDGALTPVRNKTQLPFVTIDPTFTVSNLPQDLAETLWTMAGAAYSRKYMIATIPCSQRDKVEGRVSIQFSNTWGPKLTVPLSDLVLPMDAWSKQHRSRSYYDDDYDEAEDKDAEEDSADDCLFGAQNITAEYPADYGDDMAGLTIGAPFLKRSYLVFDLAAKEVAMAPVKFGASSTEGDIVPFPSYGANIPESTHNLCFETQGWLPETYNCSYHQRDREHSGGSDDYGGLSRGGLIGLIVGMSIFGLVLLGVAIWGIVKCTRDNRRLQSGNVYMEKAMPMGEEKRAARPVPSRLRARRISLPVLIRQHLVPLPDCLRSPKLACSISQG